MWERNSDQLPPICTSTGDWTYSILVYGTMLQPPGQGPLPYFFLGFCLFLEKGEGKEKEKETSMCGHLSSAPCWGPGPVCPDWELNWWPLGSQASTQSTELHQPGHFPILKSQETRILWCSKAKRLKANGLPALGQSMSECVNVYLCACVWRWVVQPL